MTLRRKANDSGFALVMVLIVLAIAGTILAASVRRSCRQALRAAEAMRDVQVRWGSLSCSAVFLPAAERLLKNESSSEQIRCASTRRTFILGDVELSVVISDEQAKADVNAMARRGRNSLASDLRALQKGQRRVLEVRLEPAKTTRLSARRSRQAYAGFDQVFVYDHPADLVDPSLEEKRVADRLTFWGGKLNFKRADIPVMREVLKGVLTDSQVAELAAFADGKPDCTLAEALREIDLTRREARRVGSLLTDSSRSYSIWVVAKGKTRDWYRLYVSPQAGSGGSSAPRVFVW